MQAHRFQFSTYYIDIQPNCEYRINEQHVFFVLFFGCIQYSIVQQ